MTFETAGPLGLGAQTVLHDALGGPNVTLSVTAKETKACGCGVKYGS